MAKYLKQDSEKGFIEDNAEIEYTQFNNLRHSVLGCMMGDFDNQGVYVISPEVRDELISMPKYLVDSMDNIDICASVLKLDKQLTFMVTFEGDRAILSLLEKISYEANVKLNSGTYSNINEYILDEIETSGVVNKNAVYLHWNISEFGGTALDVFNMDEETIAAYYNIVNRFKYLMVANTILLENEAQLEEIESAYANRLLDILKAYPKLKEKVEQELKETLEEKKDFIRLDKPNFAKTLNEVIEKVIENNIEVLSEKQQEEFKQEKHDAQMEANIRRREIIDITTEQVDKKELKMAHTDESEAVFDVLTKPEQPHTVSTVDVKEQNKRSLDDIAKDYVKQKNETKKDVNQKAEDILSGEHVAPESKVKAFKKEDETTVANREETERSKESNNSILKKKVDDLTKNQNRNAKTETAGKAQEDDKKPERKPSAGQQLANTLTKLGANTNALADDKRRKAAEERRNAKAAAAATNASVNSNVRNAAVTPPPTKDRAAGGQGGGTDTPKKAANTKKAAPTKKGSEKEAPKSPAATAPAEEKEKDKGPKYGDGTGKASDVSSEAPKKEEPQKSLTEEQKEVLKDAQYINEEISIKDTTLAINALSSKLYSNDEDLEVDIDVSMIRNGATRADTPYLVKLKEQESQKPEPVVVTEIGQYVKESMEITSKPTDGLGVE